MSAAARKRSDLKAEPVPVPPSLNRTRTLESGSSSLNGTGSETATLHEVFERVFTALQTLAPEGELLVCLCSPLSHTCDVELASGTFAQLKGRTIDVSKGVFSKLMVEVDSSLTCTAHDLRGIDPAFGEVNGEAALFRIDLAGDLVAMILYFQKASNGAIPPERVKALRSIAELTGQAACSSDLILDVQAQQLHLDKLRAEIEEVQQFYRQFSDAIQQCFWVADTESGKALVVSENFERVWGADKQILVSGITGFMDNVLPADRDRVLAEFHTQLGKEFETELRVIDAEGEIRWIWLRAFPTRNHLSTQGAREGRRIVLIADDITARKTEEERVRAREADLVARARLLAVSDLASGVAHEINNPLTVIVGKAAEIKSVAGKTSTEAQRLQASADKIQQTSMRISEIISSLKSLSRHEKLVFHRTEITRVVHDLRDMISERYRNEKVQLHVGEMPAQLNAELNPTLITQLLLNLLNNSFDAVQGETEKWIKLEATEDDDSVYLFVTDSGPGIPIKNRSRIFDPFFTTKEPGKGTGLGLSIAASIAAHHNGMLRLDTFHPHTRFALQLPKRQRKAP